MRRPGSTRTTTGVMPWSTWGGPCWPAVRRSQASKGSGIRGRSSARLPRPPRPPGGTPVPAPVVGPALGAARRVPWLGVAGRARPGNVRRRRRRSGDRPWPRNATSNDAADKHRRPGRRRRGDPWNLPAQGAGAPGRAGFSHEVLEHIPPAADQGSVVVVLRGGRAPTGRGRHLGRRQHRAAGPVRTDAEDPLGFGSSSGTSRCIRSTSSGPATGRRSAAAATS